MRYAVGDRLIYTSTDPRSRTSRSEVVVYKAGRRWGYAKAEGASWPQIKFDLETGYEDSGQYAARRRVVSAEQLAEEERHGAARESLVRLGVRLERHGSNHPAHVLERIIAILTSTEEAS
jgi:hypothetical protein